MSVGGRPIGDDDLEAFIDGRLAPERVPEIETYLAAHPSAASRVATDRALRDALRERLAFKAQEPVPARLRVTNIMADRRRIATRRLGNVAAAFTWLVVGGVAGWSANTLTQGRSATTIAAAGATQDAISAYRTYVVETVHPVEVRADQEAHLVQWLSRRLGKPLSAPNLTAEGFRLVGGRLLPAGQIPAAMFMYDDDHGTRLTLYTRAGGPAADAAFRFETAGDVAAFSWIESGLSYVVTARTDRMRLLDVAQAIDRQLGAPGATPRRSL